MKIVGFKWWKKTYFLPGVRNSTIESSTVTRPSRSTRRSATSCQTPLSIRCFDDFTFTGPLPRSICRYKWPPKISNAKRSCCKNKFYFIFLILQVKNFIKLYVNLIWIFIFICKFIIALDILRNRWFLR